VDALWAASPLWEAPPLWEGAALEEVEALGVAGEDVAPDSGWPPFGEQAPTPRARADSAVTARKRRILIMRPSYGSDAGVLLATPVVTNW
jgi:hypothetical protein